MRLIFRLAASRRRRRLRPEVKEGGGSSVVERELSDETF